jgi:hypothetical protein
MKKILATVPLIFGLILSNTLAAAVFTSKTGNFEFYTDADPLTDEDRSFIAVDALEVNGFMAWKCQGEDLEIYIRQPKQTYSLSDEYSASFRFDKDKAIDLDNWTPATNEEAIFIDSGEIKNFTSTALRSNQIIIRTTSDSNKTALSTFKLNGLKDSLEKLTCWDI